MDRGIDTRSPIAKKSMQPRMLRMFAILTMFFYCILFGVFFFVTAHATLTRITVVTVEGGSMVPNELVEAYVAAQITRSIVRFLPQDSIVSIARRGLERDVLEQFKMIQGVQVSTQGLHTVRLVLKERDAVYAYCDDRACVALSDSGEVLAPILGTHSLIAIRGSSKAFTDRGGEKVFIEPMYGQKIVNQESWEDIMKAVQTIQKHAINIQDIEILPFRFFVVRGSIREQPEYVTEFRMRSDEHFAERLHELELAFENGLRIRATQEHLLYVISYVTEKVIYMFKE
jgi:hypothetical protein